MDASTNFNLLEILLIIIIPSFVAGLPAIISAIGAWKGKRKRVAESLVEEGTAAEKVSLAWEKLVGDLEKRTNKMDERLTISEDEQRKLNIKLERQKKRINYLEDGVKILIKQLKDLGVQPNFILKTDNQEGK
jgi:uncharacterized coiled-coil protein SlyX